MSAHTAQVAWERDPAETFTDNRYQRRHRLSFDGGIEIAGSSALTSVPLPWSDPAAVDPEEMFVASLASCHMLWFLSLAAAAGWRVDRYVDAAVGTLTRGADGRMAMTVVTLKPQVAFGGERRPTAADHAALHHEAHERCFIANSVRTEVRVEPGETPP